MGWRDGGRGMEVEKRVGVGSTYVRAGGVVEGRRVTMIGNSG